MKTATPSTSISEDKKPKAENQSSTESILQAYKQGTAQFQSVDKEDPVQQKENKTGLPDSLKSGVENLSGYSLDDVKVHYNSSEPATLQAHAYAQGTNIHVAPGQEKHLPHEAWHVVQQKQGRVQPTKQLKGTTNINDDAGLEKEADVMGAKAMQLQAIHPSGLQNKSASGNTAQLETSIEYGDLTGFKFNDGIQVDAEGRVGTSMTAHLDPEDERTGTDTSGSDAFNNLFQALQKNTNSTWVRGHLLNHDLGGIAHYNNLFPITTAANGEHYHEVEKIIKHWVGKNCEVDYNVTATKTGGDDLPEGKFDCEASVTDDPNDNQPFLGKKINKTIHSKVTKVAGTHKFKNGTSKATNKFAKVVLNGGNDTFRDSYKGKLSKKSSWNHDSGSGNKNNYFLVNNEIPDDDSVVSDSEIDIDIDMSDKDYWNAFTESYDISPNQIDKDLISEIIEWAKSEANDQDEFEQIIIDDLEDEGYTVTSK